MVIKYQPQAKKPRTHSSVTARRPPRWAGRCKVHWALRKTHLVLSLAVSSREDLTFCRLLADRKGERVPSESPSEAAATSAVASTSQRVSGCVG